MKGSRFFILAVLLIFISIDCIAQDTGEGVFHRAEKKKPAPPKDRKVVPKPAVKQLNSAKKQNLILTTNEDCEIFIDEKKYGSLHRNDKKIIVLPNGKYNLLAISNPGRYRFETQILISDSTISVPIDLDRVITVARKQNEDSLAEVAKKTKIASAAEEQRKAEIDENSRKIAIVKLIVDSFLVNMVSIPGGSFTMGYNLGSNDEGPEHAVKLNDFRLGKYEITRQQWSVVMGRSLDDDTGCVTCPVENINALEIDSFLSRINVLGTGVFRLPSEAEWEYAASKGGDGKSLRQQAWYKTNSGDLTHPVGSAAANNLGIYDLLGNVAEWCSDWYGGNYYKSKVSENPRGPVSGKEKVVRGGAFNDGEGALRSSYRSRQPVSVGKNSIGFRLAMNSN